MSQSQTLTDEIQVFYRDYYRDEISELAQKYPQEQSSLWVDMGDVFAFNPDIADDVKGKPDKMQDYFEEALRLYDLPIDVELANATVRFHNFNTDTKKVDKLRDTDVDKLRSISGQISKVSEIRPVVKNAAWECQRCGTFTRIPIENKLQEPHECQGCERQGPFELNYNESVIKNHQLIRIKQPPEEASNSSQMGGSVDAHIEGDLVGFADAGERADVPGILRAETGSDDDPTLDFYVDGVAIDKPDNDYRSVSISEYRNEVEELVSENNPFLLMAESVAPGISGGPEVEIETPWGETYNKYWWIRLSAAVANLIGGWRRKNGDGTYHRGNSHMLLIGDPSTGKSSIMSAIEMISPRSVSESGKNATGPGLTAAAVQDDFGDSQFTLEAGALVKAHNGVACIDEIDKMKKDALSRLHSALEKQRLEINKGGIDATLKCETSMLASGNPKDSRFNSFDSDQSQIDIVSSLLDRFDLVFTLKDIPDEDKDSDIARNVIEQRTEAGLVDLGEIDPEERNSGEPAVELEKLRAWVGLARQDYRPVIRDDAVKQALEEFYVDIRLENGEGDDAPVPATVRNLEAVLRLSEACARLRLSDTVEMIDAQMAISLIKVSLEDIGYDPETGVRDADVADGRTSQSQQDRISSIRGIIDTLEGEEPPEIEDVVETAVEAGIAEDKAEHEIKKLKQKGEAYSPRTGTVRLS